MTIDRPVLALFLVLALAAGAAAGPVKDFEQAAEQRIAQARTELTAAAAQMEASLAAFEAGIKANNLDNVLIDTLLDDTLEFHSTVVSVWTEAGEDLAALASDGLEELTAVEPLNGIYPKDFLAGGGGAFDQAVKKLGQEVRKAVKKARKAAAKAVKGAAKSGVDLVLDVRVPRERTYSVPNEAGSFSDAGNDHYLDVYLVGAVSRLDVAEDVRIFGAGGMIGFFNDDAHFRAVSRGPTGSTIFDFADAPPIEDVVQGFDGWKAILDGAGSGLREGNWVVSAAGKPSYADGVARVGIR